MELGEQVVELTVRTVSLKGKVLRQLPWRFYLTWQEKENFEPLCWFNGVSIGLTHEPVILGAFHGTPILYSPGAVQRTDTNEIRWGKGGEERIPFAVVL